MQYIRKRRMPSRRVTVLFRAMKPNKKLSKTMVGMVAKRNELSAATGAMRELAPRMISELKALDPRTFPRAISVLPLFAARTEVAISGRDVPTAIKKNATRDSSISSCKEMDRAEEMRYLAPK